MLGRKRAHAASTWSRRALNRRSTLLSVPVGRTVTVVFGLVAVAAVAASALHFRFLLALANSSSGTSAVA
eukprot:3689154-Rhodomonas_salina.1